MSIPEGQSLLPLNSGDAAKPRPIFFIATFWGKQFRDWFCLYAISSLLAKNNIPFVNTDGFSRFLICTTREDWDALQRESIFRKLREAIDVVFVENDALFPGEHKYHRMSRGHAMLANECFKYSAVAININPDSIYPDGCVREAKRLLDAGKNVILCTAVRFELEGVRDELAKRGLLKWGHALTLPMREAVKIGLEHLHAETKASDWAADNFGRLAPEHERTHLLTCCFWRAPRNAGCIIITHNWAPFLVNYAALPDHRADSLDGRAIDGNYIYDNFRHEMGTGKIHVVTDSDDIFLLGLSPKHEMVPPQDKIWWKAWPVLGQVSRGYILNQTVFDPTMDPLKRVFYRTKVRWHKSDMSPAWDSVDAFAQKCINRYTTQNLNIDCQQADMYADESSIPSKDGKLLHHRIWFRLIGRDAFRPHGAPTQFQFIRERIIGKLRGHKSYVYFRAALLAVKGDRVARQHIINRLKRVLYFVNFLAIRTASVAAIIVVAFLLVNTIVYALIHYNLMDDFNVSDADRTPTEAIFLQIETEYLTPRQRDDVRRIAPAATENITLIIGKAGTGRDGQYADSNIKSALQEVSGKDGRSYLAFDTIDDRFTLQQESLLAALGNGLQPTDVIILFDLQEIADAVFRTLREKQRISDPSGINTLLEFLPLVRFVRNHYFHEKVEADYHLGYEEYSLDDKNLLESLDISTVIKPYKSRLKFIEQLSKGFGFNFRAYYLPSALIDPQNQYIVRSFENSQLRLFLTRLHRQIQNEISNGTIGMRDMSRAFADMKAPAYRPEGGLSPDANRHIAKLIATDTGTAR